MWAQERAVAELDDLPPAVQSAACLLDSLIPHLPLAGLIWDVLVEQFVHSFKWPAEAEIAHRLAGVVENVKKSPNCTEKRPELQVLLCRFKVAVPAGRQSCNIFGPL